MSDDNLDLIALLQRVARESSADVEDDWDAELFCRAASALRVADRRLRENAATPSYLDSDDPDYGKR